MFKGHKLFENKPKLPMVQWSSGNFIDGRVKKLDCSVYRFYFYLFFIVKHTLEFWVRLVCEDRAHFSFILIFIINSFSIYMYNELQNIIQEAVRRALNEIYKRPNNDILELGAVRSIKSVNMPKTYGISYKPLILILVAASRLIALMVMTDLLILSMEIIYGAYILAIQGKILRVWQYTSPHNLEENVSVHLVLACHLTTRQLTRILINQTMCMVK